MLFVLAFIPALDFVTKLWKHRLGLAGNRDSLENCR
jgi:hypothetical protein